MFSKINIHIYVFLKPLETNVRERERERDKDSLMPTSAFIDFYLNKKKNKTLCTSIT